MKGTLPARAFLSRETASWISGRGQVRNGRPGPDVVDRGGDGFEGLVRQQAASPRDGGRAQEPPAHGLAVGEAPIVGHGLERVPEGVAEVQHPPKPTLALVLLDDLRLDPGGGSDGALDLDASPSLEA